MIWFTQFAIESGCIKNDMNEREFKLLVRKYFNARDVAHSASDSIQASAAKYDDKLASAKENAVLVSDQEKALHLLWQNDERIHSPIPFLYWKENMLKPGIHPIPDLQWEVKEACAHDSCPVDAGCEHCQKPINLAILKESTPSETKNGGDAHKRFLDSRRRFFEGNWNKESTPCRACQIEKNDEQVKQMPEHTCEKGPKQELPQITVMGNGFKFKKFAERLKESAPSESDLDAYVHKLENLSIFKAEESTPSTEQESQEDLWRRVERYIDWPYQEINVTELMKQFTITRKP